MGLAQLRCFDNGPFNCDLIKTSTAETVVFLSRQTDSDRARFLKQLLAYYCPACGRISPLHHKDCKWSSEGLWGNETTHDEP
jgi:hypothetical protein